jgi:hypothetical protein
MERDLVVASVLVLVAEWAWVTAPALGLPAVEALAEAYSK